MAVEYSIQMVDKNNSSSIRMYPVSKDKDLKITSNNARLSTFNTGKDIFDNLRDLAFTDSIQEATTSTSGLLSSEDKTKLDGIEEGANVNTITGVKGDDESTYRTGNVNITKGNIGLGNVENKSSSTILNELASTNVVSALGYTPVNSAILGENNGIATLDANGKILSTQLPSFVDDVLEVGIDENTPNKAYDASGVEVAGETGKIYVDAIDIAESGSIAAHTATNKVYRWSGSLFVVISDTIALGETSTTAYRGDRGKTAYDHALSNHARVDATKTEASETNGNIKINGSEVTIYTHPSYTEQESGIYKITIDTSGHVSAAVPITKQDIVSLGIPGQDTTYQLATDSTNGLMSSTDKVKLDALDPTATVTGVKGGAEDDFRYGNVSVSKINIGLGNVDNTSDIEKTVNKANTLVTARKIFLTGDIVGETVINFDGSQNAQINTTNTGVTNIQQGSVDGTVQMTKNGVTSDVPVTGLAEMAYNSGDTLVYLGEYDTSEATQSPASEINDHAVSTETTLSSSLLKTIFASINVNINNFIS